jgi:hypothetical protein
MKCVTSVLIATFYVSVIRIDKILPNMFDTVLI